MRELVRSNLAGRQRVTGRTVIVRPPLFLKWSKRSLDGSGENFGGRGIWPLFCSCATPGNACEKGPFGTRVSVTTLMVDTGLLTVALRLYQSTSYSVCVNAGRFR